MGTIRKYNGEYFYRKDGMTYKFLNQEYVKTRYPLYSDPVQIEDDQIKIIQEPLEFAVLIDNSGVNWKDRSGGPYYVSEAFGLLKKALEEGKEIELK